MYADAAFRYDGVCGKGQQVGQHQSEWGEPFLLALCA